MHGLCLHEGTLRAVARQQVATSWRRGVPSLHSADRTPMKWLRHPSSIAQIQQVLVNLMRNAVEAMADASGPMRCRAAARPSDSHSFMRGRTKRNER